MHVDTFRWGLPWAINASVAVICVTAWVKGGSAERVGACIVAGFWLFQGVLQAISGDSLASLSLVSVPILIGDFLLATGFLVLSLRYASLWLGVAMLAQGAQLAAHAVFIANGGHHRDTFALRSNLCSAVLLMALLTGTLTCWRRRVLNRRKGAPSPPPAATLAH